MGEKMDKIYIKYIENQWELAILPHIGLYNRRKVARGGARGGAILVEFSRKLYQFGQFLGP